MGITNLLAHVQKACTQIFIHSFAGKTLGVDVSCLIYKGIYHDDYIKYILTYIDLFANLHIKVVLVFDGKSPPEKHEVQEKRLANSIKYGTQRMTDEMKEKIKIKFDDYPHVTILQAPGEADAQLAFMELNGLID